MKTQKQNSCYLRLNEFSDLRSDAEIFLLIFQMNKVEERTFGGNDCIDEIKVKIIHTSPTQ